MKIKYNKLKSAKDTSKKTKLCLKQRANPGNHCV